MMNLHARYLIIYLVSSALIFLILYLTLNSVEKRLNYFLYTKGFSANYPGAIVGKDNWLFLGNAADEILVQTRGVGTSRTSPQNIATTISTMKQRHDWLTSNHFTNMYVIAPNKHSIYPEYLPDWITIPNPNATDQVVEAARSASIHFVDLRKVMLAEKQNQLVYHRYDSHWNYLGAYFAYQKIIAELNKVASKPIISIENVVYKKTYIHEYVLAVLLKIETLIPKDFGSDFKLEYEGKHDTICVDDINKVDFKFTGQCKEQENGNININSQPRLVTNPNGLNKLSVLWLRDSMGDAISPLFHKTFSKIYAIHHKHLHGIKLQQFILKHKPDIVLYQVVERIVLDPAMHYNFDVSLIRNSS